MAFGYRFALYNPGRHKSYTAFCKTCGRETPQRRYKCSVCKTPVGGMRLIREQEHREILKEMIDKGGKGALGRLRNKAIKLEKRINNAKRDSFKQSAAKFRKMFEGG